MLERYLKDIPFASVLFVSAGLFIINPLLSIIGCLLLILVTQRNDSNIFILLSVLISLYFGLINTTKIPKSDLEIYQETFYSAGEYSFWEYIFLMGKEPAFMVLNYLLYKLTNGSFFFYMLIFTFLSYELIILGVYKYLSKLQKDSLTILFGIVFATFFYQQFQSSAHLMRQFLAGSVLAFYLVYKFIYNKDLWYMLVLSVFIHSSALFFIPLVYINGLSKPISAKLFVTFGISILLISVLMAFILQAMVSLTAGIPFVNYIFFRLGNSNFGDASATSLGIIPIAVLCLLVGLTLYNVYLRKNNTTPGNFHFLNIFLCLALFLFATLHIPLLSQRFFFFVYFFLPFIITLMPTNLYTQRIKISAIFFLILLFFFELNSSVWTYDSLKELLFKPVYWY